MILTIGHLNDVPASRRGFLLWGIWRRRVDLPRNNINKFRVVPNSIHARAARIKDCEGLDVQQPCHFRLLPMLQV